MLKSMVIEPHSWGSESGTRRMYSDFLHLIESSADPLEHDVVLTFILSQRLSSAS